MMMPQMLTYPQRTTRRKKNCKWHGPLPVSAIEKVLLQDNRFADSLLTKQLTRIRTDRHRAERLLAWQEQSFVLRQAIKETELREMGLDHTSFLPEIVMKMTEPDVRARRPFGRARRSATQLNLADAAGERLPTLMPTTTTSDRKTRESQRTAATTAKSDPFLEQASDKRIFTRLHGIDLPLYGPHAEAEREKREREYVHYLQRQQAKAKVTLDPRFRRLEETLIRSETDLLPGLVAPRAIKTSLEAAGVHGANDEGVVITPATKSAKALRKLQAELSQKPKSVFAKSVWIDFS